MNTFLHCTMAAQYVNEKGKNCHSREKYLLGIMAIDRAAKKEVEEMYQLSGGGADPVMDDASFAAFENGEIEEVRSMDFATYREIVLERIGRS